MAVIYVYGFTEADGPFPEQSLAGVLETEVERVAAGDVAAIFSRCQSDELEGEALERNTADVEWIGRMGLAHEQVVAWFVDHGSILPARLLTLFSEVAALRDALERDRRGIREKLDRFADVREWDLKVGSDPAAVMAHLPELSPEVARLDREIAAASPGRRFLLEKKREDLARSEGRSVALRLARELLDATARHARATRRLDPPSDAAPATLAAALLVPREKEEALRELVGQEAGRLQPLGLTIQLTGPWAPYRFMGEQDDE